MLAENQYVNYQMNKNRNVNIDPETPIGRIIRIDNNNEIVMNLINADIDNLLKYSDYYYGNMHGTLRSITKRIVSGYVMLDINSAGKYSIRGIILYRHEIMPGSASIILLYGESVKLREKLIIRVMDYLRDNSIYNKLIIYANSFDPEDSDVYMDLKYRFYDARMSDDGGVAYVSYRYEADITNS